MMVGYLFLSVAAGSITSLVALMYGASLVLAIGIYTLIGTLTLVALNLTAMFMGAMPTRNDGSSAANTPTRGGQVDLAKASINRL